MATYSAGSASISIGPNLRGFGRELNRQLRTIHQEFKVDIVPEMGGFRQQLQASLESVRASVPVNLDVDTAGLRAQLEAIRVTVPVSLDVDTAAARTQLESLGSVSVAVQATGDLTSLRVVHAQMQAWLAGNPLQVRVDVDNSILQRISGQLGQVSNNANRASASTSRVGGAIRSIGGAGARVGMISAGVAAIGGAAGMAAGAVGGLAVGFAGLGAVAMPAIGGIAVGLQGIGGAFAAFGQAASGGGGAAADASSQIASAEHGVQMALRSSKDAQEDLTRARKDARREIDDMNMSLKESALDEREAAIAVADARDELARTNADPAASARDRQKAQLRLEQAQLRQEEAAKRGKRLAEDTAEANKKGVEGSDQVVAAKRAIADADYQVAESRRALADAQKAATAGGGADPVADALAKLAPNAREFVLAVHDMGDAWNEVKMSTQDALFAGAADDFKALAQTYLPVLKTGLTAIGTAANGAAKDMSALLQQEENVGKIGTAFAGSAVFIDQAKKGMLGMTQGLIDVGAAAGPAAAQLGAGFGAIPGEIGKAFSELANNGAMTQLFQSFGELLQNGLGPALGDLIRALTTLGNAVLPALTPMFAALGDALVTIAPALGTLGAAFADALVPLLPIVAQFVSTLAAGLTPILPILGEIIGALGQALMPIIPPLSQALQTVGKVIADILPIAGPVFTQLVELFAQVLAAVAPLLPPLVELAAAILTPLIGIVQSVVAALAPFIEQLAVALQPVIEALAPILVQVGQTLGEGLAQAIQTLMPVMLPLIQAVLRLVEAWLPMLPPLTKVAAELIPMLLVNMQIWLPIITKVIELLARMAEDQMKIVVPVLEKLGEWVGKVSSIFTNFGSSVETAVELVKTAIGSAKDWIVEKFTAVVDFFQGFPDKISSVARGMWDGIKEAFRAAVNFIIDGWNAIEFKIPGFKVGPIGFDGFTLGLPDIPRLAGGGTIASRDRDGRLRGPGTGTSDSIFGVNSWGMPVVRVANGEGVVNEQAMRSGGADVVAALNAGWVPSANYLAGMLPGLAAGGVIDDGSSYGLPAGTNTGGFGSSSDLFPPWVHDLENQHGVKASTYPGHQESDRGEAGYAPNPQGLNRGIDWVGPLEAMQAFADWLMSVAPNSPGLEQVIWQNPQTGQKAGWAGRNDVTDSGYFASDYGGHQDHVHTRQSAQFPSAAVPAPTTPDPTVVAPDTAPTTPTTVAPDSTTSTPETTTTGTVAPSQILRKFGETTGGIVVDSLLKIFDPGGDLGPQTALSAADRYGGLAQAIVGGRQPESTTPGSPAPEAAVPMPDTTTPTTPSTPDTAVTTPGGAPNITWSPSGGAEQWRPLAEWAIDYVNKTMKGPPQTTAMVEQIGDESGGDPKAQNNWDINAQNGVPSGGLLQVIEPTFQAHRDKSLPDDKFDPVANLVAALHYYAATYGEDLTTRWGSGKGGYRLGGYTGNGGVNEVAGVVHGQEFVVNAAATRRNLPALQAINAGADITGAQQSWRPGVNITNQVTVSNERSQMRALRQQDERILMQYGGALV